MADPAVRQYVLKVHSRCNLACDYCYVYEAADQSWRDQPRSMAPATVRAIGERVAEHAQRHGLGQVSITLHGGEPLLLRRAGLHAVVDGLRRAVGSACELQIGLQTNGVLLDRDLAGYLLDERITVGISLDGGREANDRHRLYPRDRRGVGRSSYDEVVRAIRLMASDPYRQVFDGLLITVDPQNDPVALFRDMVALDPGRIDLLLPHSTWESPPPAAVPGQTVYGDWLVTIFDLWYDAPPVLGVRIFQEVMHALLGGASLTEAVGLSAPESIVIETDGSFERTDALKIAYHGAPATGYTVFEHSVDDVLQHPAIAAASRGEASLSATCQACHVVTTCGGGLFPHRYRAANGFDNPSVFCRDLERLILRVRERIEADLVRHGLSHPASLTNVTNLSTSR